MIYIVSGFARSGTTMMMEALMAGGIPGAYQEGNKYFELGTKNDFDTLDQKELDGKVCKMLFARVKKLKEGPARVVVMRRETGEVANSFLRASGRLLPIHLDDRWFKQTLEGLVDWFNVQPQVVSVDELWYHDVVTDPKAAFNTLKASGWPIDVDEAAKDTEGHAMSDNIEMILDKAMQRIPESARHLIKPDLRERLRKALENKELMEHVMQKERMLAKVPDADTIIKRMPKELGARVDPEKLKLHLEKVRQTLEKIRAEK